LKVARVGISPTSDPVKEEVFERDGGQCVKCGFDA
jgi:hypothetical protein